MDRTQSDSAEQEAATGSQGGLKAGSVIANALKDHPEMRNLSFPLSESQLEQVIASIKSKTDLPCPPKIEPPRWASSVTPETRHRSIQKYIESFEYNFTGENFFNVKGVRQNQSLFRVLEVAKRVIREALPIKCVEAVYLGIYLSQNMTDVERLPIIFNSEINGHKYGHIVLAVRFNGKLGAIGLSRRPDLMFKSWGFNTLCDLILDYKESYERWKHSLLKIKIGNLIPHEGSQRVSETVDWAQTVIALKSQSWEETKATLHKKGRALRWEPAIITTVVIKAKSSSQLPAASAKASADSASTPQKTPSGAAAGAAVEEDDLDDGDGAGAAGAADDGDRPASNKPARPAFLGV